MSKTEIQIATKDGEAAVLPSMLTGKLMQSKPLEVRTNFKDSPKFFNSVTELGDNCRMRIVNARKVFTQPDEVVYSEPKWFLQLLAYASFDGENWKLYCFTFAPAAVVDQFEELLSMYNAISSEFTVTLVKKKSKSGRDYGAIDVSVSQLSAEELSQYGEDLTPISHLLSSFIDFSSEHIEVQNFSDEA